jgi:hypothetical protein
VAVWSAQAKAWRGAARSRRAMPARSAVSTCAYASGTAAMRAATLAQSSSVSRGAMSNTSRMPATGEPKMRSGRRCSSASNASSSARSRSRSSAPHSRSASSSSGVAASSASASRATAARAATPSGEKSVRRSS